MKHYLIVGGSSGIGLALTQLLAAEGCFVHATFSKHPMESSHESIIYHPMNVLDETIDVSFLPDQLDGIVYCPGAITLKPFQRITVHEFEQDYRLQVLGAVKLIQLVLPRLKQAENAAIVLFSTIAVQKGFPFHSLVSASKGAIEGLARSLAAELAPGIRVNCIAPSITETPLAARLLDTNEKKATNAARHPLKKIGNADDIAAVALFLLSDRSSWITGQVLHVDGGLSTLQTL